MIMKQLLISAALVSLLAVAGCAVAESQPTSPVVVEAQVTRVVSGDTIEVLVDGQTFTVKYLGIAAPTPAQRFGVEALARNKALVEGKAVKLEPDSVDADSSGRLLRYVYVDGVLVNSALVQAGLAKVADDSTSLKYYGPLIAGQTAATKDHLGIWASQSDLPATTPPPTGPIPPNTSKSVPPPIN